MSAAAGGAGRPPLIGSVRAAYLACVVVFGWAVTQFYFPATGFTSLIEIGDAINERQTDALRQTPHYVYEQSTGYDSAYYVQFSLDPLLRDPKLGEAIDNPQYRARRILFSWTAWLAGLGRPAWIVQAHALLNVVCWLALAGLLLRWFPATGWENFFRWFGVMFSHGLCMSVRDSLTDGPSLLLVALALAAWEDGRKGRGFVFLALAGLTRETGLLAATAFAPTDPRDRAGWKNWLLACAGAALPLLAWVIYLRWKFGLPTETGLNNFTLPLAGLAEKWGATVASLGDRSHSPSRWVTLAATAGLTVQAVFFFLRWRPRELSWRVGATFVGLMATLATPVWEGLPGAAGRALLPMTLAFNLAVPRGRRWLAVLIAGNLTVAAAYKEFSPPTEFFTLRAPSELATAVAIERTGDWYGPEDGGGIRWRWSAGHAGLRVQNNSGHALTLLCSGHAAPALDERRLRISAGEAMVWSGELDVQPAEFQFGVVLPPGETTLTFSTDKPAHPIGTDERTMAFKIYNVDLVVKPAPGAR